MHFYAWKKGLKTGMYYLRSLPKAVSVPIIDTIAYSTFITFDGTVSNTNLLIFRLRLLAFICFLDPTNDMPYVYQDAIQFTVDQTALTQTRAKSATTAAVAVPSVASVSVSHHGGGVAGEGALLPVKHTILKLLFFPFALCGQDSLSQRSPSAKTAARKFYLVPCTKNDLN